MILFSWTSRIENHIIVLFKSIWEGWDLINQIDGIQCENLEPVKIQKWN